MGTFSVVRVAIPLFSYERLLSKRFVSRQPADRLMFVGAALNDVYLVHNQVTVTSNYIITMNSMDAGK